MDHDSRIQREPTARPVMNFWGTRCGRVFSMREEGRFRVGVLAVLSIAALIAMTASHDVCSSTLQSRPGDDGRVGEAAPPFDGALKYPFTKRDSQQCGRWRPGSQDYPYFGAPRDGNTRRHTGIDLYPVRGADTSIKAIRDGEILRIAPFYQRRNGEVTYAILIDHGEYVANYAELRKPTLPTGAIVRKEQVIGFLSGTKQLHFEMYSPGTRRWLLWYEKMPPNLMDPTDTMMRVFKYSNPNN